MSHTAGYDKKKHFIIFVIIFCVCLAEQCGADVICLNCHETRGLATGSTNSSKLNRFFDKVIERKHFSKGDILGTDKRKYMTQFSVPPTSYATTSKLSPDGVI